MISFEESVSLEAPQYSALALFLQYRLTTLLLFKKFPAIAIQASGIAQ
jgi:hypothetical protein